MSSAENRLWLVVEDNDDDFFFFEKAINALSARPSLRREIDGMAAKEYLDRCSAPPALIVSDLKMPHMDGFELLRWLRAHSALKVVPFVVLSCSKAETDLKAARELGADGYLLKPSDFDRLAEMVKQLAADWPLERLST